VLATDDKLFELQLEAGRVITDSRVPHAFVLHRKPSLYAVFFRVFACLSPFVSYAPPNGH
jgi:hypothetical protein